MKINPDDWMTGESAAKVLKIRPAELKLLRRGRRIRVRQSGSALLYHKTDVERVCSEREYSKRMEALLRREVAKCRMAALVIKVQKGRHPKAAYPKFVFENATGCLKDLPKLGKVVGVIRGKVTSDGWLFTASPLPEFREVRDVSQFLDNALNELSRNLNGAGKQVAGDNAGLN